MLFGGRRIINFRQTVRLRQHDNLVEACVDMKALIRQVHDLFVSLSTRLLVTHGVVDLLVENSLTLCWVADAYTRNTAENVSVFVDSGFRLLQARVDTAHHLASNHTDFVLDD